MIRIKKKLKFNFKIFVYLLIIFGNIFQNQIVISEDKTQKNNDDIDIEYLKKTSRSDYILGPGDGINIEVASFYYPELNNLVSVDGEGYITLSPLGRIYVSGLTSSELSDVLNKAYQDYVKYPNVLIRLINYRPVKIIMEGELNDPGVKVLSGSKQFEKQNILQKENKKLSSGNPNPYGDAYQIEERNHIFPTIFDAIRVSGGITKFSDLSNVKVIRENSISNGGGKIVTTLNISDVILKNDLSQNIRIYDKDIIKIGKSKVPNNNILNAIRSDLNPKFISVFVTGKVNFPGELKIGKFSTLNDAIDIAGGAKALKGKINYITFANDGSVEKRTIKYRKNNKRGTPNNPYLKEGDLIFVGNSVYSTSAEVISEITSPFQGIYSTFQLLELIRGD